MFLKVFILVYCFGLFNVQASDQKIGHAFISEWKPGSYGNYPGISKNKKPLQTWVWIQFDQKIADDVVNRFFDFLVSSIKVLDRSVRYKPLQNKPGYYCIVVESFITREQLQMFVDKANKYIDPTFKTAQEIEVLHGEVELQKKVDALIYKERIITEEKRLLENEKHKIVEGQRKLNDEKNKINAERQKIAQDKNKLDQELKKQQSNKAESQAVPAIINQFLASKQEQPGPNASQLEKSLYALNLPQNQNKDFENYRNEVLAKYDNQITPLLAEKLIGLGNNSSPSSSAINLARIQSQGRNRLEGQLTELEAQYGLQNQQQQANNLFALLNLEYNNKLHYFIQYILPAVAERFQSLGGGALSSSPLKNQIRMAGRDFGLQEKDIDLIIKQRFGSF